MKTTLPAATLFGVSALCVALSAGKGQAASPYYYGTYDNPPADSAPAASPAQQTQPPVVYRAVPVYRRPMYRAPAWASSNAAALGPWPWNFDFGGGPTAIAGSNDQFTGGSNFEFG